MPRQTKDDPVRELILHIGGMKTGTTALQNWAHDHRQPLMERNIGYPVAMGPKNHRAIAAVANPSSDATLDNAGASTDEQRLALGREALGRFFAEVQAKLEVTRWLVSTELLQVAITEEAQIERLVAELKPYFPEIKMVFVLRPQLDAILSDAATVVRNGNIISASAIRERGPDDRKLDFAWHIDAWSKVLGPAHVHAISYKRLASPVAWISDLTGVDLSDLPLPGTLNTAMSGRMIGLINAINSADPGDGRRVRRVFTLSAGELSEGERLTPSRADAAAVEARFEEGNARIANDPRFDITMADLTTDLSALSEEGNLDVLDAKPDFLHEMREFALHLAAMVAKERAVAASTRAANALQHGSIDQASASLRNATMFLGQAANTLSQDTTAPIAESLSDLEERIAKRKAAQA